MASNPKQVVSVAKRHRLGQMGNIGRKIDGAFTSRFGSFPHAGIPL